MMIKTQQVLTVAEKLLPNIGAIRNFVNHKTNI